MSFFSFYLTINVLKFRYVFCPEQQTGVYYPSITKFGILRSNKVVIFPNHSSQYMKFKIAKICDIKIAKI
jgi:hypothetical protein